MRDSVAYKGRKWMEEWQQTRRANEAEIYLHKVK